MILESIEQYGHDLVRPECVLCTSNGRVYVTNANGGLTIIEPDGMQNHLLAKNHEFDLAPNGICLLQDGSVLLAHLGAQTGGVFRLFANGYLEPFLTHIDGEPIPPTNYVHLDHDGRVWITVSTRKIPRALGYNPNVTDGFIILVDEQGPRIVADNLGYTNECVVHPDGKRLFVNETFGKKLTSFDISEDGSLTNKTTIVEFGIGTFPDGLTFDSETNIWITSIVSNRIIKILPDGKTQTILLEDNDPEKVKLVEDAFNTGNMTTEHLGNICSKKLKNISSLAFGGANLDQIYLGCLLDTNIYTCSSPVLGHPPSHWNFAGPSIGANIV